MQSTTGSVTTAARSMRRGESVSVVLSLLMVAMKRSVSGTFVGALSQSVTMPDDVCSSHRRIQSDQ